MLVAAGADGGGVVVGAGNSGNGNIAVFYNHTKKSQFISIFVFTCEYTDDRSEGYNVCDRLRRNNLKHTNLIPK